MDSNFKQLYLFDVPISGVYQGMEYHNGYLYLSTFENPCSNGLSDWQLYCLHDAWSSITYVYNVKFNSDGTPTNDFGRIVERLNINGGIGELESVSFYNNQMYFGYAASKFDSTYVYKFYSFDYSNVAHGIDYDVSYIGNGSKKTIYISSKEELKNISGWNLSSDLHTLSKQFTSDTAINSINVCDLYNNCSSISLKDISFTNNNYLLIDDTNKIIYKLKEKTTVDNILTNIDTNGKIIINNNDGDEITGNDIIKTGNKLIVDLSNDTKEYILAVSGDVTGDGKVNIADVVKIADHTLINNVLNNYEQKAAEVTGDDKLNIADVVKIADYTLNREIEIWK